MSRSEQWRTIPEVIAAAHAALPEHLWYWSGSGSESEVTVRRNRAAFERLALLPRVLQRVDEVDCEATFLGHRLALPVILAPVGLIQLFDDDGARAQARAGARAGTATVIGTNSEPALEEVRAACKGPLVFQLYTYGDRNWVERLVRRVEASSFDAICLTVDSPDAGIRDRYLPLDFEQQRRSGSRPNVEPMPPEQPGGSGRGSDRFLGRFTWEDVAWLRETTSLPLVIKGILSPADASLAVDHGAQAIHVSNHGGRRQDHLPSTLEVLPAVLAAVSGRAEVVVDGGFLRGTDVVKAIAMGASCIAIGKLMIWALAADGENGLVRTLDILRREITATMANVGASCLAELHRELVIETFAPPLAPWPLEPIEFPRA